MHTLVTDLFQGLCPSLSPAGKRQAAGVPLASSGRFVSGPTQLRPPPGRQRSAENRAAARRAGRCASLSTPHAPPHPSGSGCPRVGLGPRQGSGAHSDSRGGTRSAPRRHHPRPRMRKGGISPQETGRGGEVAAYLGSLSRMLGQSQSLRLIRRFLLLSPPPLPSLPSLPPCSGERLHVPAQRFKR